MSRYRILIAPEGIVGNASYGYDPEALTAKSTVPIFGSDPTTPIGVLSGIERVEIDGVMWLVSDSVVFNTDVPTGSVDAQVTAEVERIDVAGESKSVWVESGTIDQVVFTDEPQFSGTGLVELEPDELAELVAEASALAAAAEIVGPLGWAGILAVEGEPTGDGRMLEQDSIYWEDDQAPWPLKFDRDEGDHSAAIVGEISRVWREGNLLMGEGWLHTASEDPETLALVSRTVELLSAEGGAIPGVSIELDSEEVDVRVDKAAWDEWQEQMENWLEDEVPEPEDPEVVDGRVTIEKYRFDDWMNVTTSARFRGAAIVDNPAFADARIAIAASGGTVPNIWLTGVVAHGAPNDHTYPPPPADWFSMAEPDADDPRVVWVNDDGVPVEAGTDKARPWGIPLTITDEGQVYGHIASWQDCHTAFTDRCITPPRSPSDYAWFNLGVTKTTDGAVPTGRITVGTGHPDSRASAASAVAHYDNTGHAVADVHASNGELGPWVVGRVVPWATDQQRHELAANPPSGDWRPRGGATELVGILSVNVPGFPLPRTVATFRSGKLASLVASGFAPIGPPKPHPDESPLADRVMRLEARLDAEAVLASLGSE